MKKIYTSKQIRAPKDADSIFIAAATKAQKTKGEVIMEAAELLAKKYKVKS